MVQQVAGSVRIIAKVKRKVRLAAGLDDDNRLSEEAMQRGWDCLALFAERLREVSPDNIKIVATATLRLATNRQAFCDKAREILGFPVEVISGLEEADLIYHGVAATSDGEGRRLVIDIGGASTELVLGDGNRPLVLNSLDMGCVTFHERFFADGLLTRDHFDDAAAEVAAILAPVLDDYLDAGWQTVLGASGSVQAVQEVLMAQGLSEVVTLDKLQLLIDQTIACGSQEQLALTGLQEERKPVFASGLAILTGLFQALKIAEMSASGGALREGLIAQLLDHQVDRNVRRHSSKSLQQRFQIDTEQADKVSNLALSLAAQLSPVWTFSSPLVREMLDYAAQLHEVGLSIGYPKAQEHSGYILQHTELAGFSRQQRRLLSLVVANFRAELDIAELSSQGVCSAEEAGCLVRLLRLAVILVGRRSSRSLDEVSLKSADGALTLGLPADIWQDNPLLMAELRQEEQHQAQVGWSLTVNQL